ncbi:MAG: phasin family protein [Hyphomicrobiaceae bacterium]
MNDMHQTFIRQTEAFIEAARDGRMPEGVQAAAQEGIARTREAYETASAASKVAGQALGQVAEAAGKGAMTLAETAMKNMSTNIEAAFDAASRVARAKSIPEAARLQVEFMQSQLMKTGEQGRAFLELSAKVSRDTIETVSTATGKCLEGMRKVG